MTIKNQYNLDVDIKRAYTGIIPSFSKGDTNEIIVKVLDNGDYFNINTVEKVIVTYKDATGKLTQKNCELLNLNNHKVIFIDVSKLNISVGSSDLTVTLSEGNNHVTLQKFKVVLREGNNVFENEGKKVIGIIDNIIVTVYPISIHSRETVLNKDDAEKLLKASSQSAKAIGEALSGVLSSCIECTKEENKKRCSRSRDRKFAITSIPLQLLTKVYDGTSNKEIECILSTIRNLDSFGFDKASDEGIQLSRIEKILEDRIVVSAERDDYIALVKSTNLLKRVKECYSISCWN